MWSPCCQLHVGRICTNATLLSLVGGNCMHPDLSVSKFEWNMIWILYILGRRGPGMRYLNVSAMNAPNMHTAGDHVVSITVHSLHIIRLLSLSWKRTSKWTEGNVRRNTLSFSSPGFLFKYYLLKLYLKIRGILICFPWFTSHSFR